METLSFAKVRNDFPILEKQIHGKPLIYFDTAATAQKPRQVLDALSNYYQNEYGTVHRAIYQLAAESTKTYNGVREKVARFIGVSSPDEIVFTKGTTDAINLVALSYGSLLSEGDEIIISEMEHHSNMVPWQLLCERKKCILRIIPVNDDAELDLSVYKELLSPKTKIVSIAHISNATGTINPIQEITYLAHSVGAKVVIDAAQSIAHLPLNVQDLDIDFLAFSSHKAFGPTGIGVLYGKKSLLEQMPPIQGGGDMIERVTLTNTTFQAPPLRFEAGTPPIAQAVGLGAALDYLSALGLDVIADWEHALLLHATEKLEQIPGLRIIGTAAQKSSIISFIVEGVHTLDIATLLDLEGIAIRSGHHCCQPLMDRFGIPGTCRISFAPFNTLDEINFFVESLQKTLKLLCK